MRALLVIGVGCLLCACGGGGGGGGPQVLTAGQTAVIAAGESLQVPATTTVFDPSSGTTATLAGDHSVLHVSAGARVTVPGTATGPADDTVTTL